MQPWQKTLPQEGFTEAWLTKEVARKDAPRREVGDRRSGLRVRFEPSAWKTGTATWIYYERMPQQEGGKPQRKKHTLGHWPLFTIEAAREQVKRIKGTSGVASVAGSLHGTSPLDAWLDLFIAQGLSNRKDPAKPASALKRFVRPRIGKRPLSLLSPPECAAVVAQVACGTKRGEGGPKAARRIFDLLTQAFNFAVGNGVMMQNPMAALSPDVLGAEKAEQVERKLGLDEVAPFWRLLACLRPTWAGHAARILLLTGARPGELTRARWANVDLTAKLWRIPGEDRTKGGKPRPHTYPLTDLAVQAFEELRTLAPGSPYVVAQPSSVRVTHRGAGRIGQHAPVKSEALAEAFETLPALPGGRITPRDLRRSAGFLAQRCKATWPERQYLVLGHAMPRVAGHYEPEQDLDRHREIAESMSALVLRLVDEATSGKVTRLP